MYPALSMLNRCWSAVSGQMGGCVGFVLAGHAVISAEGMRTEMRYGAAGNDRVLLTEARRNADVIDLIISSRGAVRYPAGRVPHGADGDQSSALPPL
jgi:hypothetical protein